MVKWFFSSSFFLFLGNWTGQIALNWFAYQINHNALDLAYINFFRLVPIFILSLWAGALADRYSKSLLVKISVSCSLITTTMLTVLIITGDVSIYILYFYALIRGVISALETPVRQAILPELSNRLSVSKAVSYHSFILNVCRSIGPALAGFLIALFDVYAAFVVQSLCYLISLMMCLPLHIKTERTTSQSTQSLAVAWQYLKTHHAGRRLMFTSFLIMATGYCYTTMMPILTDYRFPNNSTVFGTAMTMSAIGGIIATICIPKILNYFKTAHVYFVSSILFGVGLLLIEPAGVYALFIVIFLVGLMGQIARTSNRIYFQNDSQDEHRGKILSVIMMDRGMIPLGAMLMGMISEAFGILQTFLIMGIATIVIATLGYIINMILNGGVSHER
ncbi:MFS transporter [Staphylococcus canis]|uniref:MFS transporter n=1 Tax=Staphylococcus canis TaxID=2724942 RepID=A0ABS0TAW2_9STAP|nr:MFS transporter [Staphylococcus canis]MBI5975885.1 MFS transporter [Staphylococcus canis]